MTMMLLAMVFSDAALNASELRDYKVVSDQAGDSSAPPVRSARPRTPRVDSWMEESGSCPTFFERPIEGFGSFIIGSRCHYDNLPHAL